MSHQCYQTISILVHTKLIFEYLDPLELWAFVQSHHVIRKIFEPTICSDAARCLSYKPFWCTTELNEEMNKHLFWGRLPTNIVYDVPGNRCRRCGCKCVDASMFIGLLIEPRCPPHDTFARIIVDNMELKQIQNKVKGFDNTCPIIEFPICTHCYELYKERLQHYRNIHWHGPPIAPVLGHEIHMICLKRGGVITVY
jgi:hypothetical protein